MRKYKVTPGFLVEMPRMEHDCPCADCTENYQNHLRSLQRIPIAPGVKFEGEIINEDQFEVRASGFTGDEQEWQQMSRSEKEECTKEYAYPIEMCTEPCGYNCISDDCKYLKVAKEEFLPYIPPTKQPEGKEKGEAKWNEVTQSGTFTDKVHHGEMKLGWDNPSPQPQPQPTQEEMWGEVKELFRLMKGQSKKDWLHNRNRLTELFTIQKKNP